MNKPIAVTLAALAFAATGGLTKVAVSETLPGVAAHANNPSEQKCILNTNLGPGVDATGCPGTGVKKLVLPVPVSGTIFANFWATSETQSSPNGKEFPTCRALTYALGNTFSAAKTSAKSIVGETFLGALPISSGGTMYRCDVSSGSSTVQAVRLTSVRWLET